MGWSLEDFADSKRRQAAWLAELGAWLHNAGKLHHDFFNPARDWNYRNPTGWLARNATAMARVNALIDSKTLDPAHGARPTRHVRGLENARWLFKDLIPQDWLCQTPIALGEPFADHVVAELIELQDLHWYDPNELRDILGREKSDLTQLLMECHQRASRIEKEAPDNAILAGGQGRQAVYESTPFGFERPLDLNTDKELWASFGDGLRMEGAFQDRRRFIGTARNAFVHWVADARWPINDVTLYDISAATAAFFKAALAKTLMEGEMPIPSGQSEPYERQGLQWHVLRVAVNGPDFYGRAARIPDLLIRRELVDKLLNGVTELLEYDLPIANEVYRDDLGACFLVPNLRNDPTGTKLRGLLEPRIKHALQQADQDASQELQAHLFISKPDQFGLGIAEALNEPTPQAGTDPPSLALWWRGKREPVCAVCQLRPVGPGPKSRERRVCDICEDRRQNRSERWCRELDSTIWIDEAADCNGRVVLFAARLHLDGWLTGSGSQHGREGHIEKSLWTVRYGSPGGATLQYQPKRDGHKTLVDAEPVPKQASFARLRRVWDTGSEFWRSFVEEAPVPTVPGRLRLSWTGARRPAPYHAYYLRAAGVRLSVVYDASTDTLLTAENLERAARQGGWDGQGRAPEWLRAKLSGKEGLLEESTRPGGAFDEFPLIENLRIAAELKPWRPLIKILSEPHTMMVLAPAASAMDILAALREKYIRELGKVRNRLPLTAGLVFGTASVPFAAMLDTARRMLDHPAEPQDWIVRQTSFGKTDANASIEFANGEQWEVPARMGDGRAVDLWYPYYYKPGGADPGSDLVWLLKPGEVTQVTPSWFDLEFVETAGQRFEVAYDRDGRRRSSPNRARPYLLERVPDLVRVWSILKRRARSNQLHWLGGILLDKKTIWDDDAVWRPFAEQCVREAVDKATPEEMKTLCGAAANGILLDVLELWLKVFKDRPDAEMLKGPAEVAGVP